MQGDDFAPHPRWCAIATTKGPDFNVSFADIETLDDARMKLRYASSVRKASGGKTPFFVGVGLAKPHLDFRIPKLFLDRYPVTNTTALHPVAQAGRPPVSIHCPFQADSYAKKWHEWGFVDPWTPMRSESAAQMRRYYKAATSFMDWIVGELLDEQVQDRGGVLAEAAAGLPLPRSVDGGGGVGGACTCAGGGGDLGRRAL